MNGIDRYVPTRRSTHRPIAPGWVVSTLVLVLTLLTGCVPIQPAATNAAPNQAITLRFAVPEAQGRTLTPLVLEFVDQVKTLSQGSITIEPVWDPTAGTPSGGENKLIQMVLDGQFDFGLAASRSWDDQNIPSLHVLQTPFLISNDALAEAVATSEVATRLLNDLSSAGAVGLAMWPEDLRHPFSVVPDKPLLSPQDFVGAVIRASATGVTHQLIMALGATTTLEDSGYQGAESGLLHAYTLMGKPVPTGNVTFYAKFQTFFASAQAFDKLSNAQRTLVRQAATATLAKAIAEHPKEVDAATAYCADGGTIVVTTDEQVAAFEKAAKPVLDQIAQAPGNAELIAMLRDLKAKTPPSAGASACAPAATQPNLAPNDATMARLRLANFVYGSSDTDMVVDGQIALLGTIARPLTQVTVGFLTGFLYLAPGTHHVAVVPSGKGQDQAMIALDVNLEAGRRYTVIVMGQKEDAHFSPLVIDEIKALENISNPSQQNVMIFVNNIAGTNTLDFHEDGVGPSDVPYGGFVAAPIKAGHVDHLVVTVNGNKTLDDNPGNFDELPSGDFINSDAGHFPGVIGQTIQVYTGQSISDLNAIAMLKQFNEVSVVWDGGNKLSFNTFLDAVEKAGLHDMLTNETNLIFAPTDAAFTAMPKDQLAALMADPQALADFLRYHMVEGYYPPGTLSGAVFGTNDHTVTNMQGVELKLQGDLYINGIFVANLPNMTVVNGTRIVPVAKVLVPPAK